MSGADSQPVDHERSIKIRLRIFTFWYVALVIACLVSLIHAGDLSLGRKPWENLQRTAVELSHISALDVWFGNEHLEYIADDGRILRVENQREAEKRFLIGLADAIWTTIKIATLGSLIAAIVALVRWMGGSSGDGVARVRTARDILDERYARGEIDREEYQRRRGDIGAS